MDAALIDAHGKCTKLMPYLHLPVQSGSNRILKMMNRKHTREGYFSVVDSIRDARPDLLLSSDFIVGFPGETDEDFSDTLDLVRQVGYGQAYSFKYSSRPGTPAAEKVGIDPILANERLQELQTLLTSQQHAVQASMVGREVSVLFEKKGRSDGQLIGKSEYMHAVHAVAPEHMLGQIIPVRITKNMTNSLTAEIIY
jgi:tRNA-2-methylthio-N6-dimethylallyladenosine synthase